MGRVACVPWRGGGAWRSGAERVAAIGGRELDSREVVSGEGWRGRGGGEGGGEGAVCVFVSKEGGGGGGGGRRTKVAEGRRKSVCASSAGEGGIEVGEG